MTKKEKYISVECVESVFTPKDDSELADILGVSSSRISQCRTGDGIPVKTVLKMFKKSLFRINPIMELENIPINKDGKRDVRLLKSVLKEKLKKANGIYVFYDSLGEVIYVGKTKRTESDHLFGEIKNVWDRPRDYQQRIRVKKGNSFKDVSYKLKDASHYISAYDVSDEHISIVEALLTRILPNNLTNKRIESL